MSTQWMTLLLTMGEVDIDIDETIIEGACAGEYMVVRTFTAEDAGSNWRYADDYGVDTTAPGLLFHRTTQQVF